MKTILTLILACTLIPPCYAENNASHKSEEHHSHINHTLTLNHGAKWTMDTHTREMFVVMSQRVKSNSDPKLLGSQLNQDIQKLIKGCTMTGKAHDQLHTFLTTYIPAVKALAENGSAAKLNQIKQALADYKNYFE